MEDENELQPDMDQNAGRRWALDEWPWRDDPSPEFHWTIFQSELTYDIFCVQASFLEFARVAEYERFRLIPTYEAIGIKVFLGPADNPMAGEHIFMTNIFTHGTSITATLNADSKTNDDWKEGQEITFSIERLSDWFLVRSGQGLGGFTIPYVWNQLTGSEQEQCRDQAPFKWFLHRGTQSAQDELLALPECTQCGKRNIGYPEDTEQLCGICRNGSWRCNCPKCGAPLIRNAKLPKLCARCVM